MELAGPASTAGSGFTKTLTVSEEEHPLASVPVTMYCVESVGQAKGSAVVVALKLSAGVHK